MIGLVYEIWKFWKNRLCQTSSFISLKISDMIEISISNERGKRKEEEEEKERRRKESKTIEI